MDDRLRRIKELIELKEHTDSELETLIAGGAVEEPKSTKPRVCKNCGKSGHRSDTCTEKKTNHDPVASLAATLGVAQ
jgi:hypothetical protein